MEGDPSHSNDKYALKFEGGQTIGYGPESPVDSVKRSDSHDSFEKGGDNASLHQSSNSSNTDDSNIMININYDIESGKSDSSYKNSSFYIKTTQNGFTPLNNYNGTLSLNDVSGNRDEELFATLSFGDSMINLLNERFNTMVYDSSITDISLHRTHILSNSPINSGSNSDAELESNNIGQLYLDSKTETDKNKRAPRTLKREHSFYSDYSSDDANRNKKYKKLSYKDVEKFIEKYYNINSDNKYSNEIDILITFINGQKNLYVQAKYVTQYKLNLLTFPSIFLTGFATIGSPFSSCLSWSSALMTAINATILLLISLVNYLKYESAIQAYQGNAHQYDKLLNSMEMANNKLLFIKRDNEKNMLVLEKIKEIEEKNSEINGANTALIPEEVKRLFPVICNVNIFSFIKKIEYYKKTLINKLKDVKNEIRFILYKWENQSVSTGSNQTHGKRMSGVENIELLKEKNRLLFLYEIKNKLKDEILELMHAYTYIDTIFSKEISNADSRKKWLGFHYFFFCFKKVDKSYCKTNNLVIDKYFNFIFSDS